MCRLDVNGTMFNLFPLLFKRKENGMDYIICRMEISI